jgi:ABC-2 type transport system permease protein
LKKDGDRHNPNDPHFKAIKDSLLRLYKVDSVSQLPFNYAGFLMYEGEKISSEIYTRHRKELLKRYEQQNSFNRYTAFINPYIAIKNLSMALAGADFASYMDFQDQAEKFRYGLAQRMNKLQMEHISNKKQGDHDKPYSISKKHWEDMPDFKYKSGDNRFVLRNELLSLAGLLFWLILPLTLLFVITKKFKSF